MYKMHSKIPQEALFASRRKYTALSIGVLRVFLIIASLNLITVSAFSQNLISWRAEATTGDWEWGTSCTGQDANDHWYNLSIGESRWRPDCFGGNIIQFNNNNQLIMNLNAGTDYTANQILFNAAGDRTINSNTVPPNNLYFNQVGVNNAKIENYAAYTTQTFNVNVNVNPGAYMQINPVSGDLVFNNPVVNNSANAINIWGGTNKVTFNGDLLNAAGMIINQNARVVYSTNPKTSPGTTTLFNSSTLEINVNQSLGDLNISSGCTLIVNSGKTLTVTGLWNCAGTIKNYGTIILKGPTNFPGPNASVSVMNNLTIDNTSGIGVTLDKALPVSGTLNLANGILYTGGLNTLTITNINPNGITGGSGTSYITGPVTWMLSASQTPGFTYTFPIGTNYNYLPMSVIDPTTGAGSTSITAEAFANGPPGGYGGTATGVSLGTLSNTEYWSLQSSGSLINNRLSVTGLTPVDPTGLNSIGRNTTVSGPYYSVGGTISGFTSIINSNNTGGGAIQYFVVAHACIDADIPTVSASINPVVYGGNTTLSIVSGNLNGADHWQWYSGSCGGTLVGSGSSIIVFPTGATTYFVRGEGGCIAPGACQSITVNVVPACPADFSVCFNAAAVDLTTKGALPTGGKFFGDGVTNNFFYPDSAGAGIHQITYSLSNQLIAYWNFNTGVNGTPWISPIAPSSGSGSITSGSWTFGSLTYTDGFTGSTQNALFGDPSGASLSLINGSSPAMNNNYIQVQASMTGKKSLVLSYWTRKSASAGFTTGQWSYSIDGGSTFIDFGGNITISTGSVITVVAPTALDGVTTVYLRYKVWGATNTSGNTRIDNLQLNAATSDLLPCTFNITVYPEINPAPANSGSACLGETLNLTSADGYTIYSWTGPNGFTSNVQNPSIYPVIAANAGIYNISVSDAFGCNASSSITLNVFAAPTAASITTNSPVCEGGTIQLNGFPNGKITYSWTGPSGWSTVAASKIYTENFDAPGSLASSGTVSIPLPPNWSFNETGTAANTTYTAGTGSLNTGDTYSFGATGSTDRAFGGLQSGSLVPTIGAHYTNTTGLTVSTITILYTGEQWRLGDNTGRVDRLDFLWSTDATSLTTGTWTDENTLDFTAPVKSGTVGALNGNVSPNRTLISSTFTVPGIPAGSPIWIKWNDLNATGADDGLAIDDLTITLIANSNQNPTRTNATYSMSGTYNLSATDANGCIVNASTIVKVGNQWKGTTDTDWNTAANWSCGIPMAISNVIIPNVTNKPLISSTQQADCNNIEIQPGSTLTIQSDAASSGSLIMNGAFSGTGNVIYNRYLEKNKSIIISPPVNNTANQTTLTPANLDIVNGSYNIADYLEASNNWNYRSSLAFPLVSGQGYVVKLSNSSPNIVSFSGGVNGTLNNVAVQSTGTYYGWNAVGNPFTSALKITEDVNGFIDVNSGKLESNYAAIYLWSADAGNYKTISKSGYTSKYGFGSFSDAYIQAGQGFLINVKSPASGEPGYPNGTVPRTIIFNQGTTGMQVHSNSTTLKRPESSWPGITLLASANCRTRSTVIAFNDKMTTGLDPSYDAGLLTVSDFNLYTHLLAGDNGTHFAIQCLPDSWNDSLAIPIGIDYPGAGTLTLKATGVILPNGLYPVIEDRKLHVSAVLRCETDSLTVPVDEPTWGTGRFYLHIGGAAITTGINNTNKNPLLTARYADGQISIYGIPAAGSRARLYDMDGRQMGSEYRLSQSTLNKVSAGGLSSGFYLLKIESGNNRQTLKIPVMNR